MSEGSQLRILSIAHSAVRRAIGRLRYYPLSGRRDLDIHLVVPARWHEFGRTMTADPPDDRELNVHVMPIWLPQAGPMGWYLHFYPGLPRLLRQLMPDVIHLWEEPWSVVALQASLFKGRSALVMEVDQNILKRLPPPFELIRKKVLRRTDHVLSRSSDATAVVRARGYRGPVTPIAYGIDRDVFHASAQSLTTRGEQPSLRLGYVGRIVEEKGLDDALDAIARTRSAVSLAIMGDGPYEVRLRERVNELGLTDQVSIESWGPPASVARFMRSLDALILLTRTTKSVKEQFGRVIAEAQSCGVPVIGSDSGAIPDVIGKGGWVVPERTPDALTNLLDAIVSDREERHRRALEAKSNAATRFTFDSVALALANAWCAAAAARPAS